MVLTPYMLYLSSAAALYAKKSLIQIRHPVNCNLAVLKVIVSCFIQKDGINDAYELPLFYIALDRDENILLIKKGSTP